MIAVTISPPALSRGQMRTTIDRIGKYELRAVLARTPMSTVYDGWDSDIARRVAIKLMPLSTMDDTEAGEAYLRFKRGAQAAGQLNHPNIVAVYDYGETQDYAYLVMEFVDGQTLKGLFDSNQRFAVPEICKIIGSVLDALQYSHDRGVVHRDVKPANIMFTTNNQVKITDFGIARLEDSEMTQAGMVIGTPAYMSPEQFLGEKIDLRTDIYSTGVVLYHTLTGERPYEGNLATIMHKVLYGAPLLPSHISTVVTPAIDAVVTRAMARNREDRFNSAAEFNAALQQALTAAPARPRQIGSLNGPPTRPPPPSTRPPSTRPSKSSTRTLVVLAVLATLIVVVGGYSFLRPSPPPFDPIKAGAKQDEARLQHEQELSRRQHEQDEARRQQQEQEQALQAQQEQLRRQQEEQEQAQLQSVREQLLRQQAEQQQARLQQQLQQEQGRQQQEQVRQRQEQEQTRLRLVQEQARQKQLQDQARQKPAQDQNRPKGQEQSRPRQEPESAPAASAAPVLYPVTSTNGAVGLVCITITAETAGKYGLETPQGMVVTGVVLGGAADKAGIQERDVILKIKGSEVHDLSVLAKLAADNPAGQPVPVDIIRQGSHKMVQLLIDQQRR
jgi:serine/threonine protein kinase